MQYIKAKFMKDEKPTGRAYTYACETEVKPGDIVTNDKGSKLTVVDEPVDAAWIMAYGADKVGVVKKYVEQTEYRIVDIRDANTRQTRTDGRYPLRIGRIVKEPKPHLGIPMVIEYLRNSDGSDYSGMNLRTSRVCASYVNYKHNLVVETMNSTYEFEPIKSESEEQNG